jgi:hypothetical protein
MAKNLQLSAFSCQLSDSKKEDRIQNEKPKHKTTHERTKGYISRRDAEDAESEIYSTVK